MTTIKSEKTEFTGYYNTTCGRYRVLPQYSSTYSKTIVGYRAQRLSDGVVVAEAQSLKTLAVRISA